MDHCVKYVQYDYWFAILTLFFIYLPSVNVVSTLYGPKTAGMVGMKVSVGIAVVGGVLALIGYLISNPATSIIGWYALILSGGILAMGVMNYYSAENHIYLHISGIHYLLFIPIVVISPIIFVIIKFLAIFKCGNTFLQSQATYGSRGEGILEAAPQLCLQLYIILLSLNPSTNQVLSIMTSAATISLPNIENFVSARGGEFGFKPIMKNILIFLPASLFKILSVSLLALFLRGWIILVIVAIITLVSFIMCITDSCCDLQEFEDYEYNQCRWECIFLSWLTLTGLGKFNASAVNRLLSTLLVTITYSLILGIILSNCNDDPDAGYLYGAGLSWSELKLVKEIFELNLILGSTIGLGWISFLVDIIITWCKSKFVDPLDKKAGFWDEAVLLQALG